MANIKIVALLVLCFVVVATIQSQGTEAILDEFSDCFNTCEKECAAAGNGNTFCEMKCDSDCVAKETAAKLNVKP